MSRLCLRSTVFTVAAFVFGIPYADASVITYSGRVDGKHVPQAYVVAATFSPSFTGDYFIVYGDSAKNLDADAYVRAVSDGNLIPIGAGTHTALDGIFSGSGATSAPVGTSIFLFAFDSADAVAVNQVIATSTLPNWRVSANDAALLATEANVFSVGAPTSSGVELRSIPIPEPTTLSAIFGAALIGRRRRLFRPRRELLNRHRP